jgi:hypothetical protein
VGEAEKPGLARVVADAIFGVGSGIASAVYGTIVVMATIAVGYASQTHPWTLAMLVSTTALVLWLAHLYAHGLSESITRRERFVNVDLGSIARRELGILLAAVAPVLALLLGAAGALDETAAVWLALALGLITLGVEGVRYSRLRELGRATTVLAVSANIALGLLVVLLKAVIAH